MLALGRHHDKGHLVPVAESAGLTREIVIQIEKVKASCIQNHFRHTHLRVSSLTAETQFAEFSASGPFSIRDFSKASAKAGVQL